jgi:hypothetical protein
MKRPGNGILYGIAIGLLMALSIGVVVVRGREYGDIAVENRMLYLRSPKVAEKAALSFDALLADVYWIRALQHYGNDRLNAHPENQGFELLYPLLDLTTTLDPNFTVAYRFGAIFLSESYPSGPGRPDLAIALLKKGAETKHKWEYYLDIGFVYYWNLHDYKTAADWFRRGGELPGSPWWLRTYAAVMTARGGDRQTSRFMWQQIGQEATNDWLRNTAQMRMMQLDALDEIDQLKRAAAEYKNRKNKLPERWSDLIAAGLLRHEPVDPSGTAYTLNFATGEITVSGWSKLYPLPAEP